MLIIPQAQRLYSCFQSDTVNPDGALKQGSSLIGTAMIMCPLEAQLKMLSEAAEHMLRMTAFVG